jgi:hypothetical protein
MAEYTPNEVIGLPASFRRVGDRAGMVFLTTLGAIPSSFSSGTHLLCVTPFGLVRSFSTLLYGAWADVFVVETVPFAIVVITAAFEWRAKREHQRCEDGIIHINAVEQTLGGGPGALGTAC